jgi:hypothetical protein
MDTRYSRKDNEDNMTYLLRLVGIKLDEKPEDLEWQDIVNYCNLDCHYDSLRKAMQPDIYGGYSVYKYLKDKIENENVSDDNILKEVQEKKFEVETQIQKLKDEQNYLKKVKRPITRTQNMVDKLEEITEQLPVQSPYMFIKPSYNKRVIVPLCSDGQVGEMVKLQDTAGFNKYNFDTYKRRQEYYFNEIINDSIELGINEAFVPFLGDDVEGNGTIFKRQKNYLEDEIVEQVFKVSESNAWFLQSLNNAGIKSIKTMGVPGNHGSDSYDGHAGSNFDILSFDRTKLLLQKNDNIDYQYCRSFMEVVNILGYNFLLIHGDTLRKEQLDNAFYKYSYMYANKGIQLYGMLCGHFHTPQTTDVMSVAGSIIVNGNVVGSNLLGMQKFHAENKPSQTYIVIEENKGITYQRKVVLPD